MLELGLPIHELRLYRNDKPFLTQSLAGIHPRYPFMLALSQATTERLLAQAFEAAGGHVERGLKMVDCQNLPDEVTVTLERTSHDREIASCPWLLAADEAHSVARHQLGIDFAGSSFRWEWYLADVPLRTALAGNAAHAFFLDHGAFLFLIRVVNDRREERRGDPVWRVIANRPDPLSLLVRAEPAGPPIWSAGFRIAHRINRTLACGKVYFAGDAAHIHSPMGARGMNLGLEDAWVFAELARANRLQEYHQLRWPVDRRVVRQVELISRLISAETWTNRLVRRFIFPLALKLRRFREQMIRTATGLDHPLPHVGMDAEAAEREGEAIAPGKSEGR